MARFQPALVETSAQPSITRQLRAVHGAMTTADAASAMAAAARPRLRRAPCGAAAAAMSAARARTPARRPHQRGEPDHQPGQQRASPGMARGVARHEPGGDERAQRGHRLGHHQRCVDDEAGHEGGEQPGDARALRGHGVTRQAVDDGAQQRADDGVGHRGDARPVAEDSVDAAEQRAVPDRIVTPRVPGGHAVDEQLVGVSKPAAMRLAPRW